jgi:hypothetical protein
MGTANSKESTNPGFLEVVNPEMTLGGNGHEKVSSSKEASSSNAKAKKKARPATNAPDSEDDESSSEDEEPVTDAMLDAYEASLKKERHLKRFRKKTQAMREAEVRNWLARLQAKAELQAAEQRADEAESNYKKLAAAGTC